MKKLLLILLCLPFIFSSCEQEEEPSNFGNNSGQTYVPDDNFEQELILLGYDDILDNYVETANIDTVTELNIEAKNISDITGIEGFIALTYLECDKNQLTTLDLSNNTALIELDCGPNLLTSLDLSNNTALIELECYDNQLTSLDLSNNTALIDVSCNYNQLISLDLSGATNLKYFFCAHNQLTSLDLSNNDSLISFNCTYNPNLTCINVDDDAWASANWTMFIGPQHYFSENCP